VSDESAPRTNIGPPRLRCAYIWRDEVMADKVVIDKVPPHFSVPWLLVAAIFSLVVAAAGFVMIGPQHWLGWHGEFPQSIVGQPSKTLGGWAVLVDQANSRLQQIIPLQVMVTEAPVGFLLALLPLVIVGFVISAKSDNGRLVESIGGFAIAWFGIRVLELTSGQLRPNMILTVAAALIVGAGCVALGNLLGNPIRQRNEFKGISLSSSGGATFVVPQVGLPEKFTILRKSQRGYMLTLSKTMTGKLCIDGKELAIEDYVAAHDDSFRATPVKPGDWAVINLDGVGEQNFFFQFVQGDTLPRRRWDMELMAPSLALALIMHGVFIAQMLANQPDHPSYVPPGRHSLVMSRILRPSETEKKLRMEKKKAGKKAEDRAGKKKAKKRKRPAVTMGKSGKSGGKGKKRAKTTDPKKGDPEVQAPRTALLTKENVDIIKKVGDPGIDVDLTGSIDAAFGKMNTQGSRGAGTGSGRGAGRGHNGTGTTRGGRDKGSGGGGRAHGDVVSSRKIKTGGNRIARGVSGGGGGKEHAVMHTGSVTSTGGGLTAEEIKRAIRKRRGLIRTCFQKALDHSRGLAGTLTLRFEIGGNGRVKWVRAVRGATTLRDRTVEDCVKGKIRFIHFPAKGGKGALVKRFPFRFSSGG